MAVIDQAVPAPAGWLTTTQASHQLDMSTNWVRTLIARGTLQATQTPHGALIDPASVDELRRARGAGSHPVQEPA